MAVAQPVSSATYIGVRLWQFADVEKEPAVLTCCHILESTAEEVAVTEPVLWIPEWVSWSLIVRELLPRRAWDKSNGPKALLLQTSCQLAAGRWLVPKHPTNDAIMWF